MVKKRLTKMIYNKPNHEAFTIIYFDRRKTPITYVNIQKLWDDNKSFNRFVERFAKAYNHEHIHREIFKITGKINNYFHEERIVRKLMRETFPKNIRKLYKK